jgi:hypothetical protein
MVTILFAVVSILVFRFRTRAALELKLVALRGRTRTLSVLSVRSVWITSSSSASVICAAFYRAIFNTIMTPERIFRSARTARGLVPYNLPRPAMSLPSRRLAVCTIAMSVEPRRLHLLAPTPSNCRHVNFEILSKDSSISPGIAVAHLGRNALWMLPCWGEAGFD